MPPHRYRFVDRFLPRTPALQQRNTTWVTSRGYMRGGPSDRGRVKPGSVGWLGGDPLCSLPEDVQEPPIIYWTALHPVPLPQ